MYLNNIACSYVYYPDEEIDGGIFLDLPEEYACVKASEKTALT